MFVRVVANTFEYVHFAVVWRKLEGYRNLVAVTGTTS